MTKKYLIILTGLLFLVACSKDKSRNDPGIIFKSLSPHETGIAFSNDLTHTDSINIIKYLYFYNGSGLGAGDFNNDGKPDLFFGSNQNVSKLYLNKSEPGKISFEDVTEASGVSKISGWTTGVSVIDINGDNLLDIYLGQVNHNNIRGKNQLLINKGNQDGIPRFVNEAEKYGIDFQGLSTQSAFLDYDLDGDLDMYLMNHSVHSPENYSNAEVRDQSFQNGDKFYKNENGKFIDVTEETGIYSSQIGYGLGLSISDFNYDGYPDIYVGNDFHENDYLYLNNRDGSFTEKMKETFGHTSQFTMGMDVADINSDGWNDIVTLDMMPEDEVVKKSSVPSDNYDIYLFKHDFGYHYQLPRNNVQLSRGIDAQGGPMFSEIAQLLKVEDTDWSWSVLVEDYNCDGLNDIFISNGIVNRPNDLDYLNYISNPLVQSDAPDSELIEKMPSGKVSNYLFGNAGTLEFENWSSSIDDNLPGISTSAITIDLDGDGDLDIVTNNINTKATILENTTNPSKYLKLTLKGKKLNSSGLGAKVVCYIGDQIISKTIHPVRGFMSSSSGVLTIGLRKETEIDSLKVSWVGGKEQVLYNIPYNDEIVLEESDAKIRKTLKTEISKQLFRQVDHFANYIHQEDAYNDTRFEKMMPWLLSTQGPALAVADVNDDGKDDFYIGGARGQAAGMFIQNDEGGFDKSDEAFWEEDARYEDTDALFFDADGDGDQDLYVVSGGNDQVKDAPIYLDRLYFNDGRGMFEKNIRSLPLTTEIGSAVAAFDYDKDGDPDIALGTLVESRRYGFSRGGMILGNDGSGKFQDVTRFIAPELINIGMITDIEWADIDGDNDHDIVVVGEWMPITLFINKGGRFTKQEIPESTGLWRSMEIVDTDGDGKLDIIGGNFGLNTFLSQGDLGLLISDHDVNSIFEPLIYYGDNENNYPLASRDLLISQMNTFRNLHPDYKTFANSTFESMFDPEFNRVARNIQIDLLESSIFKNKGNLKFEHQSLPRSAQMAPVFDIEIFNSNMDIAMGGNWYEVAPYIGRSDASFGNILKRDLDKKYEEIPFIESGFAVKGPIRKIKKIRVKDNDYLVIAINNGAIQFWQIGEETDEL